MINLHNGCYCTEPRVNPTNWNKPGAKCDQDWFIWYRFYDPTVTDARGKIKPKLCLLKGMNKYKSLAQRRELVPMIIEKEIEHLRDFGYNPITSEYMIQRGHEEYGEIHPEMPFIDALRAALQKMDVSDSTRKGIRIITDGVEKAAFQLHLNYTPICKVSRRNLKAVLERCGENSKKWSATRYNAYRSYLLMLYRELVEQEAVAGNPVRDISKKTVIQKIRPVLSAEDRKRVREQLRESQPHFYNFVELFFHSGVRITELLSLKPGNVDLSKQVYRAVIKKGRSYREVDRTIKDIAVPLWRYFLEGCPDDMYIFGPYFKPGKKPMYAEVPSRYWKKYVKEALGIKADFYSLKHLNSTEVVTRLDEEAAATLNGHTSTAMVVKIYDVEQQKRQHNRLKGVNNQF